MVVLVARTDKSVVIVLLTTEEIEKVQPPKERNTWKIRSTTGVLYTIRHDTS